MATYAIGDIQGCFAELHDLLQAVHFDPLHDRLCFVGDLVNRGPQSLETLRFIRDLGDRARIVLGNHDLHLIAIAYGVRPPHPADTLTPILDAPDGMALIDWLRRQPLAWREQGYLMAHAGILPAWDSEMALQSAGEVSQALGGPDPAGFLRQMYGNQPDAWHAGLSGNDRLRLIVNVLTRMRFITPDGHLNLSAKGRPDAPPDGCLPWFEVPRVATDTLVFGHWAALGLMVRPDTIGLDSGCVWGEALTALRLEDRKIFQVPSRQPKAFAAD